MNYANAAAVARLLNRTAPETVLVFIAYRKPAPAPAGTLGSYTFTADQIDVETAAEILRNGAALMVAPAGSPAATR
jgi:hypothetical protein